MALFSSATCDSASSPFSGRSSPGLSQRPLWPSKWTLEALTHHVVEALRRELPRHLVDGLLKHHQGLLGGNQAEEEVGEVRGPRGRRPPGGTQRARRPAGSPPCSIKAFSSNLGEACSNQQHRAQGVCVR